MKKSTPAPRKQQSISSFFTPKPTVNGTQASQRPPPTPKEPGGTTNGNENLYDAEGDADDGGPLKSITNGASKRPLEEEGDDGRQAKRSKSNEGSSAFFTEAPCKSTTNAASKSKISSRTERYLYKGSSQPPTQGRILEEDEDAEEAAAAKAKKEELHRKFVKKLGHPDSIAMIRRRNWQINEETEALGNGDDEEAEEEEPRPKAKKKGAKTGKLTPLEIQILDIKRKHMDTLLIVEVGYKFKFFGEDARTAAKELSIVCIPGKFRYDERKSKHRDTALKGED